MDSDFCQIPAELTQNLKQRGTACAKKIRSWFSLHETMVNKHCLALSNKLICKLCVHALIKINVISLSTWIFHSFFLINSRLNPHNKHHNAHNKHLTLTFTQQKAQLFVPANTLWHKPAKLRKQQACILTIIKLSLTQTKQFKYIHIYKQMDSKHKTGPITEACRDPHQNNH